MPCDALTYSFIAKELNELLCGGKIDKITMPKHDLVMLFIRRQKTTHILSICAGTYSRIHLTKTTIGAPASAYSFCMNLRKNILGGIIDSVVKQPDERVVVISINFLNELNVREDKRLICEIMGKYSNIILTSTDNKIYECLKHIPIDSPINRPLLPNLTYTPPSQDKLSPLDKQGICALPPCSIKDLCAKIKGLAPISFYEAVFNAKLLDEQLSPQQTERLCDCLNQLYTLKKSPCVGINGQNVVQEFFVRPYNSVEGNYIPFDTLNEAADYFYTHKEESQRLSDRAKSLASVAKNALKKCHKRINELSQSYQAALNFADDKLKGDLIIANIYKIKQGDTTLLADNFYAEGQLSIALDTSLSPSQNAARHYKIYAKKKRALAHLAQMLEKSRQQSEEFELLLEEIASAGDLSELEDIAQQMHSLELIKVHKREKNSPISKPHKFVIDGFDIYAGKNSLQNERLTKEAQPNDIWLHVKSFRGSHVIIRAFNSPVPQHIILKAAQIAAFYSKAGTADKVEVDYTLVKHVSKPSLSPLGKVVYKNYSTIIVKPVILG